MTQPFNPDDYLGPYADDATDQQKASLARAAGMVATRYTGPDSDADAALSGAAQIILGDATLTELAAAYARARTAEREAMATLTGAIIAASETMAETAIERESGVTRMTVRKALGK